MRKRLAEAFQCQRIMIDHVSERCLLVFIHGHHLRGIVEKRGNRSDVPMIRMMDATLYCLDTFQTVSEQAARMVVVMLVAGRKAYERKGE